MKYIVVLTGAGISQESGIKTFRDSNGLWENHRIEDVANPEGYSKNPQMVHKFYNLRREQLKDVRPNLAHIALAKLDQDSRYKLSIITQNVDDLHERAGATDVIHMHGELKKIRHTQTQDVKFFEDSVPEEDFLNWRPDIVWFGESIKYMSRIEECLNKAELFICIGTSNQVYPAAGFVSLVKDRGVPCIELNYERTNLSDYYDKTVLGKAGDIVPDFIVSELGVHLD